MPAVTICKTFDFDAAHQLPNVPDGHKCKRLHGHTYSVDVMLHGVPDERGFVVDYAEISEAWKTVHEKLDHRFLNEIPGLENPSTEVLAPFIFNMLIEALPLMVRVRVHESSSTWCEVTKDEVVWEKYR